MSQTDGATFRDELQRRMALPQRHRLLQGYPMMPLHREAVPKGEPRAGRRPGSRRLDGELRMAKHAARIAPNEAPWIQLDGSRPLIVGLLPHAQCNPKKVGCGFCTFPHDRYAKGELLDTVRHVARGIDLLFKDYPEVSRRRVDAVYFGGATANLTPGSALLDLGRTLAKHLDLSHAEVTLEGVPSLFRSLLRGPFEALLDMPARQRRLSMGVQTFDQAWIARMGRQAFGDFRTVSGVVQKAHSSGLTVSGDFLINLPGQPLADMLADVEQAAASGLDQICIYHLVLTPGTGAIWAEDPVLMAALPNTATSLSNWLRVREWLLSHGFVQTTLTNFERATVHGTPKSFAYEEHSFSPGKYDALGFGPMSISTFSDPDARRAVKLVRGKSLDDGVESYDDLLFLYGEEDMRLLYVTRTLARMRVDRAEYMQLFAADIAEHFGDVLAAVGGANLARLDTDALHLTPEGMFFADSVAGLFAWQRTSALRGSGGGTHTRDLLEKRVWIDSMG